MNKFQEILANSPMNTEMKDFRSEERFGLKKFSEDFLVQYLEYLKGLQLELESNHLREARFFYFNSITKTQMLDHSLRKLALLRLMNINKKLDLPNNLC